MAQTITIKAKMGHTFMALSLYNVEIGCNTKSLPNQGLNQKNSVCKVQAPTCLEKNSVYSPHFFRWNWNFIETLNFIKTTSVQVHPTRICPNDSTCALTRHLNFVICLTCCVLLLSRLLKNVAEKNQFHLIMLGWILENTGSMTILETMMNNYIYMHVHCFWWFYHVLSLAPWKKNTKELGCYQVEICAQHTARTPTNLKWCPTIPAVPSTKYVFDGLFLHERTNWKPDFWLNSSILVYENNSLHLAFCLTTKFGSKLKMDSALMTLSLQKVELRYSSEIFPIESEINKKKNC